MSDTAQADPVKHHRHIKDHLPAIAASAKAINGHIATLNKQPLTDAQSTAVQGLTAEAAQLTLAVNNASAAPPPTAKPTGGAADTSAMESEEVD